MRQGQSTLTRKDEQVPNPHEVELDAGIRHPRDGLVLRLSGVADAEMYRACTYTLYVYCILHVYIYIYRERESVCV